MYLRLICNGCEMRRVGKVEALCRWSEWLLLDNQWRVCQVRDNPRGDLGGLPVVTSAMGCSVVVSEKKMTELTPRVEVFEALVAVWTFVEVW